MLATSVTTAANVGGEIGMADAAREVNTEFRKRAIVCNGGGTHLLGTRQPRQLQRHRAPEQGSQWASWWRGVGVVVVEVVVLLRCGERCWLGDTVARWRHCR
jgi:hypothetical protein